MSDASEVFSRFESYGTIVESEIVVLKNYVARNLVSWSPNYEYYESIYNEFLQLYSVIKWRERNGFLPTAKRGEKLQNNQIVFSCSREFS